MSHHRPPDRDFVDALILETLERILHELRAIRRELAPPTPTAITFKEITMLAPDPGNTLVFTGTLSPTGSAFPTGTTFTVSSPDPLVKVSVDATGLIVTAAIDPTAVVGTVSDISWSSSTFTSVPDGNSTVLTATIPLTIGAPPPPPTPTPTSVSFSQTT